MVETFPAPDLLLTVKELHQFRKNELDLPEKKRFIETTDFCCCQKFLRSLFIVMSKPVACTIKVLIVMTVRS